MAANSTENKFSVSWHDSAWIPILNAENVLEYFCQRSNIFYDKTCNNELVKMQRLDPAQIQFMTGIEYTLIHVQEPILYVIRKQNRHSQMQVTPLALYYILAGIVYQAPDVGSMINSRLLSTIHKLQSAFDEAQSYSRYNPSKGYWWQFKDSQSEEKQKQKRKKNKALEASSLFQRQRVDLLISNFAQLFPPKMVQQTLKDQTENNISNDSADEQAKGKTAIETSKASVKVELSDVDMNLINEKNTNAPPIKRKKKE